MAPCMSAAIACSDFLQTSGKLPASLTMPPFWPPMPSAQVLQAFLLRIASHSFHRPPIRRDLLSADRMARHPPPQVILLIAAHSVWRRSLADRADISRSASVAAFLIFARSAVT